MRPTASLLRRGPRLNPAASVRLPPGRPGRVTLTCHRPQGRGNAAAVAAAVPRPHRTARCQSTSPPSHRKRNSSRPSPLSYLRTRTLASQSHVSRAGPDPGPTDTLFSLPDLSSPSDFVRLANEATRECDAVRRLLASSLSDDGPAPDRLSRARETLHMLDDISNLVCTVIDAAELCRSVHASDRWRRGAADAFGLLSGYIGNLNADERLYRSLRRFVFCDDGSDDDPTVLKRLPSEYRRMARAMRKEFERDGIHLDYDRREEARELNDAVVGLETLFTSNITERTKHFDVDAGMAREVDRIVPRHVLGQLVRSEARPKDEGGLTLSSDGLLCNTLLAHSPSPSLRREVYMQSNTAVPENLDVLDSLVRSRHRHSELLGYKSYAHRVLSDRLVETPEKVAEFLDSMERGSREVFRRDMAEIAEAKRRYEGNGDVEPWDVPFYTTLLKSHRRRARWESEGNSGEGVGEETSLSGYFTVENSIEGMKVLCRDLFGIEMREEADIPPAERWDLDESDLTSSTIDDSVGGLRKFTFRHDDEGPLGTMYLDLHPRPGKFGHAAHFTIRCGRVRPDGPAGRGAGADSADGQLPIVALVCNLSPPTPGLDKTVLSHSEVETLFHEFGHGLHSMLSRTAFQHLSGTRAAMDFVETPSHLIEAFARDPSFLSSTLARHHVTGEPMSVRAARHLSLSHADFRGVEVQSQIVHSKFDQALFGEDPCSPSLGGPSSVETWVRLHRESGVPIAAGTHWHTRFGHLVTYGAGYYGYLFAQTWASDVWRSNLAPLLASPAGREDDSGPSDPNGEVGRSVTRLRDEGTKVWKGMLVHGGARDPKDMIRDVLGREPGVGAFFAEMS